MIPTNKNFLDSTETETIQTSKTFLINFDRDKIQNKIDGLQAIKQSVFMILNTERTAFSIYPLEYGVSLNKYIGKDVNFIKGDIGREITESLLKDRRILSVENFEFRQEKEILNVKFRVVSIYGDFLQEVNVLNE